MSESGERMASEADILHRAIDMMEDALELLDSVNATHAGALLDHAIHAARDHGDITGDRRPTGTDALLWKCDMSPIDEPGTSQSGQSVQDSDHLSEADRA